PVAAIVVLPSGRTTSSIVRLPATTTRGAAVSSAPRVPVSCARCAAFAIRLLGRDLPVDVTEIDAAAAVVEPGADVPEHAGHDDADHEVERQPACDGERRADGVVEHEDAENRAQADHAADAGEGDHRDA